MHLIDYVDKYYAVEAKTTSNKVKYKEQIDEFSNIMKHIKKAAQEGKYKISYRPVHISSECLGEELRRLGYIVSGMNGKNITIGW